MVDRDFSVGLPWTLRSVLRTKKSPPGAAPSAKQRDTAPAQIAQSLHDLQVHGLVHNATAAVSRVIVVATLEEAVYAADYVQECGLEMLDVKLSTFAALDAVASPHCVLASSTSAIVASLFTESLAGRARCIVAHPVNPPHLAPVVEPCGSAWTSDATKARAREVMLGVGQVPIDGKRSINRVPCVADSDVIGVGA